MNKLILVFLLILSPLVSAKDLFFSVNELGRIELAKTESAAISAAVNTEMLKSGASEFGMHLPGGGYEVLEIDRLQERSHTSVSWFGHIKGQSNSTVHFSIVNGFIAGSLHTEKETFEILPLSKDRVRIAALLTDEFEQCDGEDDGPTVEVHDEAEPEESFGVITFDVMVVYTPEARDAAGGVGSIEAIAQSAVDTMNQAFTNSMVDAEVRLSFTGIVPYNDSGSSSDDLNWVRSNSYVAELRSAYGADLVSLLVNDMSGCGRGYVMRSPGQGFAGSAFQVTKRSCAIGNLSFAHEFGHNMGLEHNPEDSSVTPATASNPWSFGHYHNSSYRTVMSYSGQCANGCSRRQYYSNPDVQYNGLDTGVEDLRDNARTLRQTASIVSDFRPEANDTIFEDGLEG